MGRWREVCCTRPTGRRAGGWRRVRAGERTGEPLRVHVDLTGSVIETAGSEMRIHIQFISPSRAQSAVLSSKGILYTACTGLVYPVQSYFDEVALELHPGFQVLKSVSPVHLHVLGHREALQLLQLSRGRWRRRGRGRRGHRFLFCDVNSSTATRRLSDRVEWKAGRGANRVSLNYHHCPTDGKTKRTYSPGSSVRPVQGGLPAE